MYKYFVSGLVPNMGLVQHVIRADTKAEAKGSYKRAHPKCAEVQVKLAILRAE